MSQIIPRYKIFPRKNVANGDRPKYFLQKMLQKYEHLCKGQIVLPAEKNHVII